MKSLRRILIATLALLLVALTMTACKTTLTPGEHGLYDSRNEITYSHASTVYEATALVKEYGKLSLSKKESYALYTIPGEDAVDYLATEDYNILYAADVELPTLMKMAPTILHICNDGGTVYELKRIEDSEDIYSLVYAYDTLASIPYPATNPQRSYKARFESTQYPGFYYTLTYLEYEKDIEVDGKSYGKYFLRSTFDNTFIPVSDVIHEAMGLS